MLGKIKNKILLWKKWVKQDVTFIWQHLKTCTAKNRVVFCDTADHDNLGDHAIALAQRAFVEKCLPNYDIIEIPGGNILRHTRLYKLLLRDTDVVTIAGGGFLGSLWEYEEKIVQCVLHSFPENRIVIYPQTFFVDKNDHDFFETHSGYLEHRKLCICLRDLESCNRMNQLEPALSHKILYMPDMVFGLIPQIASIKRRGIGVCFRDDIECVVDQKSKELLLHRLQALSEPVEFISTIEDHFIEPKLRKEVVDRKLEVFASKKLIISDRLHAMLFAAITGTPCIALNNKSGKVLGSYRWIQNQEYIWFAENMEQAVQLICKIPLEQSYVFNRDFVDKYWENLAKIILGGNYE